MAEHLGLTAIDEKMPWMSTVKKIKAARVTREARSETNKVALHAKLFCPGAESGVEDLGEPRQQLAATSLLNFSSIKP